MKDLSESRILIVDDVKANVDVLVQALRDEYKLERGPRRRRGLRSIEKDPPDLVLLDIVMPDSTATRSAAGCGQPSDARGSGDVSQFARRGGNKAQGFEVGGNDYLTKPFEMLEVKARVRSLLRAKAYADAVQEAMARDLRIAREIQMGILPADLGVATRGPASTWMR